MDGFNVMKPATGPGSSYVIGGFQIAIIKVRRRKEYSSETARTQKYKLTPKVYAELKSMYKENVNFAEG
jgi:hypothetical protein